MKKRAFYAGIVATVVLIAIVTIPEIRENYRTIEPPYPEAWNQVSTGMTLSQVSSIVGMKLSNLIDVKTTQHFKLNIDGTELVLLVMFHRNYDADRYIVDHLVRYKKRDDIIYQRQTYPW